MRSFIVAILLAALFTPVAFAQETPPAMVASYDALADTILAVRQAEANFVRALLDGHRHAAATLQAKGDWEGAAAQIALFANEGDNAIGGVRKRLLEGGHHFNAEGEKNGLYEPGFVIVTQEAKKKLLKVATDLRRARSAADRDKLWSDFNAIATDLLKTD